MQELMFYHTATDVCSEYIPKVATQTSDRIFGSAQMSSAAHEVT